MGYDLRITRSTDWAENAGLEIGADEWLAVVEDDPELTLDPANGPYAVRWSSGAWLDWYGGNVFTSDPDRSTVAKMLSLAERLSGLVQGDDGEFYESVHQWRAAEERREPGDPSESEPSPRTS